MMYSRLQNTTMLAVIGTLGLVLTGCAENATSGASTVGGVDNCAVDSDCPGGQMCRAGFCSTRGSAATDINFRFLPSNTTGFLPQYRENVRVQADDSVDFLLQRGVTVSSGGASGNAEQSGGIRYADSTTPGGPDGTLLFRPQDASDGLFIRQAHVDDGRFDTTVNPGVYTVTFVPDESDKLPKKTWRRREFNSNTVLSLSVLPSSEYLVVDGRLSREIVWPDGTSGTDESVNNVRVYALSTSGEYSSTEVIPTANGEFDLRVAPETGTYDLYVVPASSESMVPSVRFDAAFDALATKCVTSSTQGGGEVCAWSGSLGAYPAEPATVSVQLVAPDGFSSEDNWQGTSLVVRGPLGRGNFARRFSADNEGKFELTLFPADWSFDELRQYTLEVIPPARSPFVRKTFELTGAIGTDVTHRFELDLKERVTGSVLDAGGNPMASAELEFRLDSDAYSEDEHLDERAITVTTDEEGRFEAWLEPMRYDVHVVPPESSGQPRTIAQADVSALRTGEPLQIELPRPTVLVGSVFGAESSDGDDIAGVGDVSVEAYRVIDGRTVILGKARTDADGRFRMVVSSEL
ncbi:hypothetical protein FIV42_28765 [Persicimonas caeni]|uniref:Carboxypeptidase regulatory-like domain-containing protein n=1 Tax=Persicimonas caeni TaxID=2292766 RepID=A0A4Y6Q1Y4_PERCE|nr:hypothetical protein [Persicimonas caeni]QDG54594.1 hypothetical protein FIV42_28765 [Persicimonas caeni]QED35815.1 hypothetical protein FRD00_28760 [Persicimonas caeni]